MDGGMDCGRAGEEELIGLVGGDEWVGREALHGRTALGRWQGQRDVFVRFKFASTWRGKLLVPAGL